MYAGTVDRLKTAWMEERMDEIYKEGVAL